MAFGASTKPPIGVSLRDRLMVGPHFQKDLFLVLIRFWFHQKYLSADIAKMYRQVQNEEKHEDFPRVLWKNPNYKKVKIY